MSKLPSPDPRSLSGEVISESDPGSEVAAETDRFGFILANGTTASIGPPPELVRQREAKWINIISQWDHILQKKNKIKEQCQKGIPASLRAKCWPMLCGATERMKGNKDFYLSLDLGPALQSWVDVIERDLDRQFPFHEMFCSKDGHGQRGLFRVLKAYTQYQPDEGYCQAQGPVAAVLLMNMPAEEAFWCLVQISEQYLPGYYSQLLEGVLFDAAMLSWVLKKTCPQAHKHLQRYGVEPLMFATDWLMCMFTRHLPFDTLLRVWDLFFCHGVRVLFQVATVLVRRVLGRAEQRQECRGQMETLERLRGIRENLQQEGDASFVAEVCSVPLSRSDLKRRTEKELERWRKDRPMSTFDPRGRCHGYWASRGATQEEQDREDRVKGNLSVPLVRSASTVSLSPSLFRKQWGKGGGRIERHHSVGVRGVGREDWMEGREKCIPRVEEEDERKASGEIQNRMDRDSPHPTEVKGRVKMSRELRENQGIQKEALKESGGLKEREGIKQAEHRTLENQSEQRGTEKSQGDAPEVSQEARRNHSDEEESTVERVATQRPGAEQGPGNISQLLQPTSPTQPPSRRREEHNNTQSQVSDEQKQEEEVSKEHTTETPEEIGKLGTGSENLVASQTDVKTNDVETQAVLHTTREQTDTTADWETMTEDGEHIEEIHADTGTMTESDSAVKISKKESTAQQAPHVIIQTENSPTPHHKPTETASNASAETRETIEASVKATYHTETQEQASVDTQIQNNESIHLQMNTLSFQGTKKGANTVDNQREEINFVVSATTDPPAETTMGTEMVSDDRDAVSPSHLSETCSEKELALPEQAQAEKETILDTDAQPERDNDRRTSNQTLTKETPTETLEHSQATVLTGLDKECEASTMHIKLDPTAGTDGNMSSSSARASEAITTEKPGKQAVVSYVEERTENNEEKAVCNPNLPHQRHTVDSQSSAMVPHVQETCAGELFNPEMMHMVRQRTSTFSGDFCVRRSSGSHESRLARRLSENIFTALQSAFHSQSISSTKHLDQPKSTTTTTATGEPSNQPLVGLQGSTETTGMTGGAAPREEGLTLEQKPAEPPKRPGFFNRLRGGPPNPGKDRKASTHKIQVPKILIQDFSDGVVKECPLAAEVHHAKLSSRERRRRRRERERRAKEEEKMRRRREKELEKERKKPQTRGRSFQLRKDEVNKEDADPSSSVLKMAVDRYSAPYSDSYF